MNRKIKKIKIKFDKKMLIIFPLIVLILMIILDLKNSQSLNIFNIFNSSNEQIIVIDPGHGGIDGGTGEKGDLLEKQVNLEVGLKLKKELLVEDYQVIMTREEDKSLEELSDLKVSRYRRDLDARKRIINDNKPLLFVSLHCNSSKKSHAKGVKIYHYPDSIEGEKLAKSISQSIDENFYIDYLGEETIKVEILEEDFFILRESDYTGVLVELGFITNSEEKALLKDDEYQQNLARAIKKGILMYLNSE